MLILHCTICSENYSGKEKWLGHLMEEEHLRKSREEFLKRHLEKGYVGTFIAMYSNISVACSDKLLQHFSWQAGTLVTDFVYWRESPQMGFIQFESEKKVKDVLSGIINKEKVCVGNYLLQVKSAADIYPFEWGVLLPVSSIAYDPGRIKIENDESLRLQQQVPEDFDFNQEPIPATVSNVNKQKQTVYQTALDKVLKMLEVTEGEYKTTQHVREELQKIFSEENYTVDICLLQTWSIKLKQNKKDCPFFQIQRRSINKTLTIMNKETIKSMILKDSKSTLSKKLELSAMSSCLTYSFKDWKKIDRPFKLTGCDKAGSFRSRHRSKMWEMMNYLCQFNPLCKPLLAIIYHWANKNLIQIGERRGNRDPEYDRNDKYFILTFLAILFLSTEGHVPTFKEILGQTQKSDKVLLKGTRINIGFTEYPKFVSSWRKTNGICNEDENDKTFAKKVFAVASRFFLHYGDSLVHGEWIINSKNGKKFKVEEILSKSYTSSGEKEPNEITLLRNALLINKKAVLTNEKAKEGECLDRILLTHPSSIEWLFKISNDPTPFEAMKTTGVKITKFLSCKKSDRVGTLMDMLVV